MNKPVKITLRQKLISLGLVDPTHNTLRQCCRTSKGTPALLRYSQLLGAAVYLKEGGIEK